MDHGFETRKREYLQKKSKQADPEEMIAMLKTLMEMSYDEPLMYELALWYWKADYPARGKRICKQMIQYFRDGEYVERAKQMIKALENEEELPQELAWQYLYQKGEKGTVTDHGEKPQTHTQPEFLTVTEKTPETNTDDDPDTPDIIRNAFKGLVGMESVKKELVGFYNIARLEKLREQQLGIAGNSSRAYNFILYGNPGTGKTTVARIIGNMLYTLGIRESDCFKEVDRSGLVSEYVGQTAKNVRQVLDEVKGGTLFIDEAYTLYKGGSSQDFGQEAIDTLLKDMEDHRGSYSVILAGYKEQMTEMLNHSNPGFRSRFTYHITIPDYSDEELLEIARNIAESHHYIIEDKGYEALKKRIERERIDTTFGNARFIREAIDEAEKNLANRLAKRSHFSKQDLVRLTAADIYPEADSNQTLEELLRELNGLTGLLQVKQSVQELLDKIAVQKEVERRGLGTSGGTGSLHMAFIGSAGTGKTTVARLLGRILGEMGILKRGDVFVEVTRADLVGQYQGHTAARVNDVIRSAMGGILFIDEAYALVQGDTDSFGKEAIDTLVAEMENHRDSLVVILAGYTGEMERFFRTNSGMRSRVTRDLFFADYSLEEMEEIFMIQAKRAGALFDEELRPALRSRLAVASQAEGFGNARGVRNLLEEILRKRDSRVAGALRTGAQLPDEELLRITEQDIRE